MTLNTTATTTDTKLILWKKILQVYQNRPGALAHNNPKSNDTVRWTLVKILRAIQGL